MLSRNVESKIEDFKNEYIDSLRERQEIKDAYIKCKGDIRNILKCVPLADSKSKKRITNIINKMISNGEVVKFPDKSRKATQNIIDNEATGTSGLTNISTPSRPEETIMDINTSTISMYPVACSTPHSSSHFSTNTFSNGSHIGIEDILKINPGFMNNSRPNTITDYKGTVTHAYVNSQSNEDSGDNTSRNSTIEYINCHDNPSKRRYTEHERRGKKLKLEDKPTNKNESESIEINEETLVAAIDKNSNVQIEDKNIYLMNNKDGFNNTNQTTSFSNKIRSNDNGGSNIKSQKKIGNIHFDNQKLNVRRNKPGPSCPSADKKEAKTDGRKIVDNKNMTKLIQRYREMIGTKDPKLAVAYSEDTVMHTACSLPLHPPNSYGDESTSNIDSKGTLTTEKYISHSNKIQVLQDVSLTILETGSSKQKSLIKKQPKTSQISNSSQLKKQSNHILSNLQEAEFALDLSRKANLQTTEKNVLSNAEDAPTSYKRITETPTIPNITEGTKKRLQDNSVAVTAPSSRPKGISKKLSVQNKQILKNLEKSRTSQRQIRDKGISKTARQEKPVASTSLETDKTEINNTIETVDEMSSKSSSASFKSVCSKREATKTGLKSKSEKIKYTEKCLVLITDLFRKYIKHLPDTEKELIKMFLDNDNKSQCICLELLTSHNEWYNVFNFSRKVRPDMENSDISDIITAFKENGFIDMDYQREHEMVLLNQLSKENLIKVCQDLEKEGLKIYKHKPEEKLTTKKMIEIIHEQCQTKFNINLLRKKIQNRMGKCMKINKNFQKVFYTVYLRGTYTNPRFLKMEDYFKSILMDKVTFPEYPIDEYIMFPSWADLFSYSKAKMYDIEFKNVSHDLGELRQICETIFAELKLLENKRSDHERFKNVPHLIQFTAKAVYVSTLSDGSDKLLDKYPNIVKVWLEYMIRYMKAEFPYEIGRWYYNLIGIVIYSKSLKPFDYNRAVEDLIRVLNEERQHLSVIQIHKIFNMGKKLVGKDGIFLKNKDDMVELEVKLLPKRAIVPEIIIDGKSGISNTEYYHILLRSTWGGDKILATFTLFFFDIIYNTRKFIPGTFVSNIQSEPLDMNTRYFYSNRQNEIEQRLREIESEWSDSKVMNFLKENYDKHSHEFSICKIDEIIKDPQTLENLVQGFGRRMLAKIYRRLAENFTEHKRGFPDLRISNTQEKKFFRMVKRKNHTLTVEELLWLDYLRSDKVEVEIMVVPPRTYKKNVKKMKNNDLPEASTSSAPDKVP